MCPVSFNSLGCLDLILQRGCGKHPASALPREKSRVLLGLSAYHSSILTMHGGREVTCTHASISCNFYWRNLSNHVRKRLSRMHQIQNFFSKN